MVGDANSFNLMIIFNQEKFTALYFLNVKEVHTILAIKKRVLPLVIQRNYVKYKSMYEKIIMI